MHLSTRMSRLSVFCSLLYSVPAFSQAPAPLKHISDGVLGHFLGTWTVTGSILGKPTKTGAQVQEILNGSFLEVHLKDPANNDRYEANVFFGEKQDGGLVVHWLDETGAETSQTLGTGSAEGNVVTLTFPYPEGAFRDKLTYDPAHDRWRLFIEMGPIDHSKVFSDWYFNRSRPKPYQEERR